MTRDDIYKAASKELYGCLLNPKLRACLDENNRECFVDGAEWRINSVWHDAKEKPAERRLCLFVLKDGSQGCGYYHKNDNTIFYERFEDVEKWAYFDDLIPNQIKENEKC